MLRQNVKVVTYLQCNIGNHGPLIAQWMGQWFYIHWKILKQLLFNFGFIPLTLIY